MAATQGSLHNDIERHGYPPYSDRNRQKLGSRSTAMAEGQLGTQSSYQSIGTTAMHMRLPEHSHFTTIQNSPYEYSVLNRQPQPRAERTSPSSSASSRCENLKRRPSLREAARSFRSSKVAKRLRRQTKADGDVPDEDETDKSASESDNLAGAMYGQRTGAVGDPLTETQRRQSVASDLTSGFRSSLSIRTHGGEWGSSPMSSQIADSSDAASIDTSLTTVSSTSRLSRRADDDDMREDDDATSDQGGRSSAQSHLLEPDQPQLFACPFAKHDSQRYSGANLDELNYRGCSQSYLKDLARVKQHLYRVHERPQYHCETCFEVFKNQVQCVRHVTSQSCSSRPCPFDEKMTPEQLLAIKKKNRGTNPYKGWYEIYKTLFPGSQLPMSPYATFVATVDTLEAFMDFVVKEVPTRLQRDLGCKNAGASEIRALLPNILRDIRREFVPSSQRKLDIRTRDNSESDSPAAASSDNIDDPDDLNFHRLATVEMDSCDQSSSASSLTIDLPPVDAFTFQPVTPIALTTQSAPSSRTFHDQNMGPNVDMQYSQEHMGYMNHDQGMMHINPDPVTAIWQPDDCETQPDYFVNSHQTQQPAPGYLLHLESSHSGIPIMTTTETGSSSVINHGATDMLNWFYGGGYGNHNS